MCLYHSNMHKKIWTCTCPSIGMLLKGMVSLAFLFSVLVAHAQETETNGFLDRVSGQISLTQNGISLVPAFSLNDPAILFNLQFVKGRFSIEPDIRFGLDGKPWSFLFWARYQAVQKDRFRLQLGVHPGYNFRTIEVIRNGIETDVIAVRRYLAGEIAPVYSLSDKVRVGMYYLYSRGLDDGTQNIHFLTLNSVFTNIGITKQFYLVFSPQVYYLKMDALDGFYGVGILTLAKRNFPLSLSSIFNQKIDSDIAGEELNWNISLVYSF